jgi:hypothetical protein
MDHKGSAEKFRFDSPPSGEKHPLSGKLPRHKLGEKFLKGPIPLLWLEGAARLPGKALHVALQLWFWAGIKRSRVIKLPSSNLLKFGVNRHAGYRGLNALERAGLVSVIRKCGRKPVVTLLDYTEN